MEYKITNMQERGEWGDGMKDYAIALEGQQGWIKLTQKLATPPPMVGSTIQGRIETKQNTNGKSYQKFTKERPNPFGGGGGSSQSPTQNQPDISAKLDYIVQMLEELTDRRPVHESPAREEKLEGPFEGLGI